jgi:uncharacterized protein
LKYLDTSAFVKYYRAKEKGSDAIRRIIEDSEAGKGQLISSFILIGEVISVFDKWARRKFITEEECGELAEIFLKEAKELSDSRALLLEPVSALTIVRCLELITKHHLSLNDAIHLSTALENKASINMFVCSDGNLLEGARKEGFAVLDPEER